MPHMNVHDLGRLREITRVLVRHGFGHLVRSAGLEVEGEASDARMPLGRRVRLVLTDLGTTFVKLGQVLSVRPDIVPKDILDELQGLQDAVPPAPFADVREALEREMGATLEERFASFDPVPIASASSPAKPAPCVAAPSTRRSPSTRLLTFRSPKRRSRKSRRPSKP